MEALLLKEPNERSVRIEIRVQTVKRREFERAPEILSDLQKSIRIPLTAWKSTQNSHPFQQSLFVLLFPIRKKPPFHASLILLACTLSHGEIRAVHLMSQNRGTPLWTPKYCSPYYGDPQKVPLILRNPKP